VGIRGFIDVAITSQDVARERVNNSKLAVDSAKWACIHPSYKYSMRLGTSRQITMQPPCRQGSRYAHFLQFPKKTYSTGINPVDCLKV